MTLDGEGPDVLELSEQGFYEVRAQGRDAAPPMTVASNIDLAESDLIADGSAGSRAAGALGRAGAPRRRARTSSATDQEQERNQRLWWYLLFAGVVILGSKRSSGTASRDRGQCRCDRRQQGRSGSDIRD